MHFDGNAKNFRDCCRNRDAEMFETAIGRVVKGCPRTPVKGKKYCYVHLPAEKDQSEPETVQPKELDSEDEEELEQEEAAEDSSSAQGAAAITSLAALAPTAVPSSHDVWEMDFESIGMRTRARRRLQQPGIYEAERVEMSTIKNRVIHSYLPVCSATFAFVTILTALTAPQRLPGTHEV